MQCQFSYTPKVPVIAFCARVARFWWSRNGKDRGIHWKSRNILTMSKKQGGIGFKEFFDMNLAFLAKQAWRTLMNSEVLWVRFLKSIYYPNDDFLRVKKKRSASWIWNSIMKGRDVLIKGGKWVVRNGQHI